MLNPHTVLNISHARELELQRAAEQARITKVATERSRRAPQRADEPAPRTSREAKPAGGPLASCDLR